ncbi:MAG: trypsin-like peptidase domain-containing protein [Desulfobacterales bacterium]
MERDTIFKIGKYWPVVILFVLFIGAIWSSTGVVSQTPVPFRLQESFTGLIPERVSPPVSDPTMINRGSPRTALLVQEGISRVVSMARPAVVSVSAQITPRVAATGGVTRLNPHPDPKGPVGSGVIIDRRGYVLTTAQTVGREKRVHVTLYSGGKRSYEADVTAVDHATDLALLKIRGPAPFPTVIIGNSDLAEVGDIVLAVGSPFGFSRTVTMGIVSSNRRELYVEGTRYPDMIQTDATINEGNDGGPLINIRGELIGINMASYSPNNSYSGIGFAIPINNILGFLRSNGV